MIIKAEINNTATICLPVYLSSVSVQLYKEVIQ